MSTTPLIYLLKQNHTKPLKTKDELPSQIPDDLINYLQSKFIDFSTTLKKNLPTNMKIEVKNTVAKYIPWQPDRENTFAEINITIYEDGGTSISLRPVSVLVKSLENDLRFVIVPDNVIRTFNIAEGGKEALLQTQSLKLIAYSLFEALNCNLAVTTNDNEPTPNSLDEAINDSLYYSKYSIVSKEQQNLLELKPKLQRIANVINDHGNYIEISITDQPFCLSDYNSDKSLVKDPMAQYQAVVKEIIHGLHIE